MAANELEIGNKNNKTKIIFFKKFIKKRFDILFF